MKREALGRRTKSEAFAWTIVECGNHSQKILSRDGGEVKLFREILTEQAIGVLIKAALARTARIGKELFCPQDILHSLVVKEFISIVYRKGTK